MSVSVSHLSSNASQETNTTGEMTSILEFSPENGTIVRFANAVRKGAEAGIPVFMDLRDSNDDPLPDDTEVMLSVDRPTDERPLVVSEKEGHIQGWNSLTTTEQRNAENIDEVKIDLKAEVVNVTYRDTLRFEVNSSAAIDWTNSTLEVYNKATQERPFSG